MIRSIASKLTVTALLVFICSLSGFAGEAGSGNSVTFTMPGQDTTIQSTNTTYATQTVNNNVPDFKAYVTLKRECWPGYYCDGATYTVPLDSIQWTTLVYGNDTTDSSNGYMPSSVSGSKLLGTAHYDPTTNTITFSNDSSGKQYTSYGMNTQGGIDDFSTTLGSELGNGCCVINGGQANSGGFVLFGKPTHVKTGDTTTSSSSVTTDTVTGTTETSQSGVVGTQTNSIHTLAGSTPVDIIVQQIGNIIDEITNILETTVTTNTTTTEESGTVADVYEISPIILDLSGTGQPDVARHDYLPHAPTLYREKLAFFDVMGIGAPQLTEWVGPNSGILCVPDENGQITSALQLFGTAGGWNNGYEKLAALYDKDHDGVISGDELKSLSVWINKEGDGRVHPGEIVSLESLGVTAISVKHTRYASWYRLANGTVRKTWDWWPSVVLLKKLNEWTTPMEKISNR